jgi:hypothetical protein
MFKSTSLQRSLKCWFCCNLFITLHLRILLYLYKYTFTMAVIVVTFQLKEKDIRISIQSSFCICHFQRANITFNITDIKVHSNHTVTTSFSPWQPRFNPRSVHTVFIVNKVDTEEVILMYFSLPY